MLNIIIVILSGRSVQSVVHFFTGGLQLAFMEINLNQKEIGFCKVNNSDIMMWKPG